MHLKNKHPHSEALYTCKLCQYGTVNETSWKQHIKDHENGLVSSMAFVNPKDNLQLACNADTLTSDVSTAAMSSAPATVQENVPRPITSVVSVSQLVPEISSSGGQVVYQYSNMLGALAQQAVMLPSGPEPLVMDSLNQQTITLQLPGSNNATQVLLLQSAAEMASSAATGGSVVVYNMDSGVTEVQQEAGYTVSDGPAAVCVEEVQSSADSAVTGAQSVAVQSVVLGQCQDDV